MTEYSRTELRDALDCILDTVWSAIHTMRTTEMKSSMKRDALKTVLLLVYKAAEFAEDVGAMIALRQLAMMLNDLQPMVQQCSKVRELFSKAEAIVQVSLCQEFTEAAAMWGRIRDADASSR